MESTNRRVVIVGSTENAMKLYMTLQNSGQWNNITVLNPEITQIDQLAHDNSIDVIINASDDQYLTDYLRKLNLPDTEIISYQSAKLFLSTAIESISIADQCGDRQKVLESLHEIRRTLYLTSNKEELLKLVLSITLQTISADSGSIMLVNPHKRFLSIETSKGLEPHILNSHPQKIGKGISGKVALSGRPMLITGKYPNGNSVQNERTDLFSSISCPMLLGNEVVGVLNVNSKRPERIFSKEDLQYLKTLTSFTTDIIKTSRVFESAKNSSFALSVLSGVQDILRLALPLQERLNLVMMRIVNNLQGKMCNLYRFDSETQHFFVQASSEFNINIYQSGQVRLNDFFTGRALRDCEAFTFSNRIGSSGLNKFFLTHPIKTDGKLTGLLIFYIISDRDQFDRERLLLNKVTNLLQFSFTQKKEIDSTHLQSIQFNALSEATFDLASIHNIRQLARFITVNACMILDAESCILNLYNNAKNSFDIFESFSVKGKEHISLLHKLDYVIALKAISEKNVTFISDLLLEGYVSEETPTRSVLTMSLQQNSTIIGTLSVYDKSLFGLHNSNSFSAHDREVFVKLCFQVTKSLNRFIILASPTDNK